MRRIVFMMPLLALGAAQPTTMPRPVTPSAINSLAPSFPDCGTRHVATTDNKAIFRRLGDLPPAEAYQAVFRVGPDGCLDPLLVSERINWPRQKPVK